MFVKPQQENMEVAAHVLWGDFVWEQNMSLRADSELCPTQDVTF